MARVLKTFRDKYSKRVYRPGDDYQGKPERLEELSKLGYVSYEKQSNEKTEQPAVEEKPKKKKKK